MIHKLFPYLLLPLGITTGALFFGCLSSNTDGGTTANSANSTGSVTNPVKAAVFLPDESRTLAVYVVGKITSEKTSGQSLYTEGMYIPQGAAAYFPTRFSFAGKERKLQFLGDISYRIMAKTELRTDVLLYTVQASGNAREAGPGYRYTLSFPRSALGSDNAEAIQPATYALERGARMSNHQSGTVRLEALRFDEGAAMFKAVTVVVPD
jgi:hypothetical protein